MAQPRDLQTDIKSEDETAGGDRQPAFAHCPYSPLRSQFGSHFPQRLRSDSPMAPRERIDNA